MSKELVIVFVKNIKLGKVKTRLAKTIGDAGAFEVYRQLVEVTENATNHLPIDKRVYFSDAMVNNKWHGSYKAVQDGKDLGARMKNAFKDGFKDGYEHIVLIGSDLPDINAQHIRSGLNALKTSQVVFGPAVDGGYYLIGMTNIHDCIFDDKPWSQCNLLDVTLTELSQNNISYNLLEALNDIDTFEDLEQSDFYRLNEDLQLRIKQLND